MRMALLMLLVAGCGEGLPVDGDASVDGGDVDLRAIDASAPPDLARDATLVVYDLEAPAPDLVAPIDFATPPDLAPAPDLAMRPHRLVFFTASSTATNFGGKAAADKLCQQAAMNGSLPGTYVAVLWYPNGPPSSYLQLVGHDVYTTVSNHFVSRDEDFLKVMHTGVIDSSESFMQTTPLTVFTGALGNTCNGWTTIGTNVDVDYVQSGGVAWYDTSGTLRTHCNGLGRIYCIQQ